MDDLETVEVIAGGSKPNVVPTASVIWMHGLGADAHDFEPVPPMLDFGAALPVRYISIATTAASGKKNRN